MSTTTDVPRSVRLPADFDARFEQMSNSTGRTKSYYMREALIASLPNPEWASGVAARGEASRAGLRPTNRVEQLLAKTGLTDAEIAAAPLDLDDDGWA